MRLTAEQIVAITGGQWLGTAPEALDVSGVTADSRAVREGFVFVAVRGTKVDGHDFIRNAVSAGASMIVCGEVPEGFEGEFPAVLTVEEPRRALAFLAAALHGDPTSRMELVGVVGTDGKTSTTMIIEAGMKGCGIVTGLLGTIQYRYAGRSVESNMTTPDPESLQKMFADMQAADVRSVVMEVSSHAIDQRRVESCRFRTGVFTNLGRDHLDYHVTMDAYREAKVRFFTEVLPSNPDAVGAVVNDDDPVSAVIRQRCPLPVIGWTLDGNPASEIRLASVRYSLEGTQFEADTPWGRFSVETGLIGRHNVANILAAIGVAGLCGYDLKKFVAGLESLSVIPGRLERVPSSNPRRVFVDYAHTPRAIESVLGILRGLCGDCRLHVVCGAGGDRDRGKRPLMGRAAVCNAEKAWITSDNPRSEEPIEIIEQILEGIRDCASGGEAVAEWEVEPDRREAIRKAIEGSDPGDVILVAGKGHENYQILKDRTIHFSDVEVAMEMLGK